MTVSEGAAVIEDAETSMPEDSIVSIDLWTRQAAFSLSEDPVFNAACWLKYNMGPCLHGESDEDWMRISEELYAIYRG